MPGTNVLSGLRAVFRLNGQKVAYASGVNASEEVMYEPVEVLDNIEVEEHVPVGYRVNFSAEIFRTIKGTGKNPREGIWGSTKEMGIFPKAATDPLSVLTGGELTCTLEDPVTQRIFMQCEGAKATSQNFGVTARGIVGQNVSFVAKRIKDESEQ